MTATQHVLPFVAPADLTRLFAMLARAPGACWLDSDGKHRDAGWSFAAADPVQRVHVPFAGTDPMAALDRLELETDVAPAGGARAVTGNGSLPSPNQVPRWVGYLAYDAYHAGRGARLWRPPDRPVLSFARYDAVLALRHADGRAFIVGDDAASCMRLRDRLLSARLDDGAACPAAAIASPSVTPASQHRAAVARALEHIAAGDIYQVNLARCWTLRLSGSPAALWDRLRVRSPVPFGFYFDDAAQGQPRVVMARTMERFLRWDRASGRLETGPIKGTIARRGDRDSEEAASLRADSKERAEHVMIVDLMRNDLGRLAMLGTVAVSDFMRVEPYAGLSHLVSTVECQTVPGTRLRQVLEATFPPGSVTGAPKRRAIDIIEQLESEPRDVYTGAVGFVDRAGGLSLAVAIRTVIQEADTLRYFAGGGIVEASDIEREVLETELKAEAFLAALSDLAKRPDLG
jgi:anthranilate/para-aminobenzoate synthase component I